jgi:5'-methylthioadenosine phosphorylase
MYDYAAHLEFLRRSRSERLLRARSGSPVPLLSYYDCWRTRDEEVRVTDVMAVLEANVERARRIIASALERIAPATSCACRRVLDTALVTPLDALGADVRVRLHAILDRRLAEQAS